MDMTTLLESTREPLAAQEVVSGLFQPDTLLAHDYIETLRRKTPLEPEKHLLYAVLADAVTTYRLYAFPASGPKRRLFLDAQRWIWTHDVSWPFSFGNICAALDLQPDYLRAGLLRGKEQMKKSAAPAGHCRASHRRAA